MFLKAIFSTCCIPISLILANPSFESLRQHHLDTSEGRTAFLSGQLAPYAESAERINQEVQDLSAQIQSLSPETDQTQILALTQQATDKMGQLLKMLPVLEMALTVEEDFAQIEAILQQTAPLSPEQQQVIDRAIALAKCFE